MYQKLDYDFNSLKVRTCDMKLFECVLVFLSVKW